MEGPSQETAPELQRTCERTMGCFRRTSCDRLRPVRRPVAVPTESANRVVLEELEPRLLLSVAANLSDLAYLTATPAGSEAGDVPGYTAFWKFDETSGPIAHDESENGFHAAVHGATWTGGHDVNALSFDNLDDYVDNDANGLISEISSHSQGSISVWFKIDTLPTGGAVHSVFYLGDGGGSGTDSFHIEVGHFNDSQQRRLYFTLIKDSQVVLCYDSGGFELIQTDTWYQFVGIVGADYNTGYLNGQEMIGRHYNVGTGPDDHDWFADLEGLTMCTTGRGVLGFQSHFNYFDGLIDEIRIYDRPLSASEITQLYEGGGPPQTKYEFTGDTIDGMVLGNGTVNTSSDQFIIGDWTDNSGVRAVMHFDTTAIPAEVAIVAAEIMLTKKQTVQGDPYGDLGGGMMLDIKAPYFGASPTVQPEDYAAPAELSDVSEELIVLGSVGASVAIPLKTSALSAIGIGQTTQMRLRFPSETDGEFSSDREYVYSSNATSATYKPKLIVHTVVLGDMNADGSLNSDDINPFVQALVDPDGFAAAHPDVNPDLVGDCNRDGSFNTDDIGAFVELLVGSQAVAAEADTAAVVASGDNAEVSTAAAPGTIGDLKPARRELPTPRWPAKPTSATKPPTRLAQPASIETADESRLPELSEPETMAKSVGSERPDADLLCSMRPGRPRLSLRRAGKCDPPTLEDDVLDLVSMLPLETPLEA